MANQYIVKDYSVDEINEIVSLYERGISYTEISLKLGRKKENIKDVLIDNGMFIEGRDDRKKMFSDKEINIIVDLYVKRKFSLVKISKLFNVSKTPIKRILTERNLLRKGNSDGKKINLSNKQKNEIKRLYLIENKNTKEIGKVIGCSSSSINKFLVNDKILRTKSIAASIGLVKRFSGVPYDEYLKNLSKYKKYRKKVISITKSQPINKLDNFDKRGVSGINCAYHLDHKYSIRMGFINNIEPEIIGNITNLEFLPWEENVKKRTNCSITINELNNII